MRSHSGRRHYVATIYVYVVSQYLRAVGLDEANFNILCELLQCPLSGPLSLTLMLAHLEGVGDRWLPPV